MVESTVITETRVEVLSKRIAELEAALRAVREEIWNIWGTNE